MKQFILLQILFLITISFDAKSQESTEKSRSDSSIYRIETYGGGEFIGLKLLDNEKILIIQTKDRGNIEIPKYEIKEVRRVEKNEISKKGVYIPDQVFGTRYFISTNGLSIKKGESYALFNIWGPDVNFGIADNLSIGVMTSWLAIPIIGTIKLSIPLGNKNSLALGLLAGHTVWAGNSGGVLPYGAYTYGTRKSNFTVSAGYAKLFVSGESDIGGSAILSVAGMRHLNSKISLVFDSWIMPDIDNSSFILLMPGLRFQSKDKNAFQFGFSGAIANGEAVPALIPMIQWFRKF